MYKSQLKKQFSYVWFCAQVTNESLFLAPNKTNYAVLSHNSDFFFHELQAASLYRAILTFNIIHLAFIKL